MPDKKKKPDETQKTVDAAIRSVDIPHLYVNGFITAMGNADIFLVLQHNAQSVATLNLSFTMAKTLSERLHQFIDNLERKTKKTIFTTNDLDAVLIEIDDHSDGKSHS